MNIPDGLSAEWSDLIEGKNKAPVEFLATRILVSRLVMRYKQDPTPGTKAQCITEIMEFFKRNVNLPAAQTDLSNIFGGKTI